MRTGWVALAFFTFASWACSAEVEIDEPLVRSSFPSETVPVVLPVITPAAAIPVAADPKLEGFDGWPLLFDARFHDVDGRTCTISISRGEGEIARLDGAITESACSAAWDGRAASGQWLAPGPLDVTAIVASAEGEELARAAQTIEIVRLGIAEIELAAVMGTGARAPLLFRKTDGVRGGFHELAASLPPFRLGRDATEDAAAVDIEDAEGNPRALPEPWADLTSPPLDPRSADDVEHDLYNLPAAFVAGTSLSISATLSASVAGADGGGAPTVTEVRVVAPEGTTFEGSDAFGHGETLVATTDASPVPNVGRYDLALRWTFEARAPGGEWQPVPGAITTVHRLYGLVDRPIFDYTDVPHRAWVDVIDTVAGWVDGATRDPDAVAGRIVEGVYYELELRYDRERGASFYTSYPSGWSGAVFDASRFQDRVNGSTINCSDAGSIVSTYANMVGIDLRYHILQHRTDAGFDLNYIQAIGWMGFTETPFTSGRGAFRYHAVVGPPDGRFFDGTLALDGDGTPTALPSSALLAAGMPPNDYKRDLSSQWADVVTSIDEKVRVR
jgi:hypothetical protein